ncbi:MAG: AAA family ATPase [Campylobacter sp.]|uniref:ATP-dependent DNA helicase n=1 Tax=Campylobacter sp. TaxID=205 RepID=UPI002AA7914A|nr:AAA family ATPase [Campylobacter sp.]MCI7247528.1 AAA family ATPase [Campylobacter sp.]
MFERILKTLQARKNVFLTGGAGTGKSYTTKCIIENFYKSGKNVVALGSTGISAVNIGGITLHSFFRFGRINDISELAKHDKTQRNELKELYKVLSKLDLIIIDEISMVRSSTFEMVAYRLRMGGFKGALLVVGDFYQLEPVVSRDEKGQNSLFSGFYAWQSMAWGDMSFVNFMLTKPKRTNDLGFFSILERIRVGVCDDEVMGFLASRVEQNPPANALRLFGTNAKVDALNEERLNMLKTPLFHVEAAIKASQGVSETELKSWLAGINIAKVLELKVGAEVIICANKRGSYYNGERAEVVELKEDGIIVRKHNDELCSIEPVCLELNAYADEDGNVAKQVLASFVQYPLRLAYAITIHKSQGMSLDDYICDVNDIFASGQLYVALSRAKSAKGLFLEQNSTLNRLRSKIRPNDAVAQFYAGQEFIKEM